MTPAAPGPAAVGADTPPVSSSPDDPTAELAETCVALTDSSNIWFGDRQFKGLLVELAQPLEKTHRWFVHQRFRLAEHYLRFGETGEAARLVKEALDADERADPPDVYRAALLDGMAATYFAMGMIDNCVGPGARICMSPLDSTPVPDHPHGFEQAIEWALRLLESAPGQLRGRWFLNVSHMMLRTYPDQVPAEHLISPDLFGPERDFGRFQDIAPALGLDTHDMAGSSIVEDFDNDGLLDIMSSTAHPCGQMRYFRNDGNGSFSDRTSAAGLQGQLGGLGMMQTDYDNDGWMDVMVLRGAWMLEDGQTRNSLLRNNGDGTFSDVTHQAGLALPAYPVHSAPWADYDNDGDLDLYACNESMIVEIKPEGSSEGLDPSPDDPRTQVLFPSQLFRNNGDGTFTDVAEHAGVTNGRHCKGSTWGDYDNDGDLDLYASNAASKNRLYRNNGDGTFTNVARELDVLEPTFSFATWFWDYNNDGWLDLYVASNGTDVPDLVADYLGLRSGGERDRLYENDGAGGFIDVTREAGLYNVHLAMGGQLRRPGQRRVPGLLPWHRGAVLRGVRSQRHVSQQRRQGLHGR